MFLAFIFIKVLFLTCMVFIIGYVFGPFSRSLALRRITRIAAILAVVLFLISGFWAMHITRGDCYYGPRGKNWCGPGYKDHSPNQSGR